MMRLIIKVLCWMSLFLCSSCGPKINKVSEYTIKHSVINLSGNNSPEFKIDVRTDIDCIVLKIEEKSKKVFDDDLNMSYKTYKVEKSYNFKKDEWKTLYVGSICKIKTKGKHISGIKFTGGLLMDSKNILEK